MGRARNNMAGVVASPSRRGPEVAADAFAALFGGQAGRGREPDLAAHDAAVRALSELTFTKHEHRMGYILDNLCIGARASRVYEHQQVLHLWPEGAAKWLSPWGQRVTFACGLTTNLRPKQRCITNLWTRVPEWNRQGHMQGRAAGRSLCEGCAAHEHEFPELSTRDDVIDGSLDVSLPAAEIDDIKGHLHTDLQAALSGWELQAGHLEAGHISALAEATLKEIFLPWASARAQASQEYIIGRHATASWMRDYKDNKDKLDARLGEGWWAHTISSLWEGPAKKGNGWTQQAFWALLWHKVPLQKRYRYIS